MSWNARDAIKALIIAHVGPIAVVGACSLCAGGMLWALHQRDQANFRAGQLAGRLYVADSTISVWAPRLGHADTVLVRDTVRVTRTIARVDSLRDTLLLHKSDTVLVTQYIARTDSALKACSDLKDSCAAFRESATKLLSAKDDKIHALESIKPRPSLLHDATRFLFGVGVGYLIPRHK